MPSAHQSDRSDKFETGRRVDGDVARGLSQQRFVQAAHGSTTAQRQSLRDTLSPPVSWGSHHPIRVAADVDFLAGPSPFLARQGDRKRSSISSEMILTGSKRAPIRRLSANGSHSSSNIIKDQNVTMNKTGGKSSGQMQNAGSRYLHACAGSARLDPGSSSSTTGSKDSLVHASQAKDQLLSRHKSKPWSDHRTWERNSSGARPSPDEHSPTKSSLPVPFPRSPTSHRPYASRKGKEVALPSGRFLSTFDVSSMEDTLQELARAPETCKKLVQPDVTRAMASPTPSGNESTSTLFGIPNQENDIWKNHLEAHGIPTRPAKSSARVVRFEEIASPTTLFEKAACSTPIRQRAPSPSEDDLTPRPSRQQPIKIVNKHRDASVSGSASSIEKYNDLDQLEQKPPGKFPGHFTLRTR